MSKGAKRNITSSLQHEECSYVNSLRNFRNASDCASDLFIRICKESRSTCVYINIDDEISLKLKASVMLPYDILF